MHIIHILGTRKEKSGSRGSVSRTSSADGWSSRNGMEWSGMESSVGKKKKLPVYDVQVISSRLSSRHPPSLYSRDRDARRDGDRMGIGIIAIECDDGDRKRRGREVRATQRCGDDRGLRTRAKNHYIINY